MIEYIYIPSEPQVFDNEGKNGKKISIFSDNGL